VPSACQWARPVTHGKEPAEPTLSDSPLSQAGQPEPPLQRGVSDPSLTQRHPPAGVMTPTRLWLTRLGAGSSEHTEAPTDQKLVRSTCPNRRSLSVTHGVLWAGVSDVEAAAAQAVGRTSRLATSWIRLSDLRLSFRLIRHRSWPFTTDRTTSGPGGVNVQTAYLNRPRGIGKRVGATPHEFESRILRHLPRDTGNHVSAGQSVVQSLGARTTEGRALSVWPLFSSQVSTTPLTRVLTALRGPLRDHPSSPWTSRCPLISLSPLPAIVLASGTGLLVPQVSAWL
jgi:hypothetical protein